MSGGGPVDAARARQAIADACLYLVFTPELCGERDPIDVLARALPHVDVIQVRVKAEGRRTGPSPARAVADWTRRVLACVEREAQRTVPVLVNDRVDVCGALLDEGCAGVHVGQDDLAPERVRELLGPDPLVGLSTHSPGAVAAAAERPVDYVGFGPIAATATKDVERGLGTEAAWVAMSGSALPLFPIGGIGPANAADLATVGRAAVASAVLAADDPARAARAIRGLLSEPDS